MQKWCLESLDLPAPPAGVTTEATTLDDGRNFRPETGFADQRSLLTQLSRAERAQLVELVELDLRKVHEANAAADIAQLKAEHAAQMEQARGAAAAFQISFAAEVGAAVDQALRALADASVALAVQLAEKLVRARVQIDTGVLVRTIETVMFKAEPGVHLIVTCNPDDARFLADTPDLRARLRIVEVKEDRRIARGGCLVKAGDLEWDATVQRQLAVLEEVALLVLAGGTPAQEGEGDAIVPLG